VTVLTFAIAAALSAAHAQTAQTAQAARPVTLVSEVRAAIAAHDLARADAIVARRRAEQGTTPDVIEATSWLARGARSDAIAFLQRELQTHRGTSLTMRIQKNINLLTMEGHPAPALDTSESIGPRPPTFDELKGKVVVLFFWAHWCPDCKIEGPILARLFEKYQAQGLAIVAPTQRYGYATRGTPASADEELRHIVRIRDQYYPFLAELPVPLSAVNHERYGVSSTPTVVILDRRGVVRLYHPGRLTEDELETKLRSLLSAGAAGAER